MLHVLDAQHRLSLLWTIPNGTIRRSAGHLLDSAFSGPAWLTGGPMGPEASVFIFPVVALLFWVFHRRYREARYPAERG